MPKLLTVLTDLLFPPSPEALLLRTSPENIWPALYHQDSFQGITFLSYYRDPLVKAAIKENKFHHNKKAAKLLATLLLRHSMANDTKTLFIPIPLGKKRQRVRGHNQVITILEAAGLAKQTYSHLLVRSIETAPQSHLTKNDRVKNTVGAFTYYPTNEQFTAFNRVILLDDVVTTGSTLHTAYSALQSKLPPHLTIEKMAIAH